MNVHFCSPVRTVNVFSVLTENMYISIKFAEYTYLEADRLIICTYMYMCEFHVPD